MNWHSIELFIVLLTFGGLVLLSFMQFVNPSKVNKKGNIAFAIFLLIWSTFWLEEVGEMIGSTSFLTQIIVPIKFLQFLTALFFYWAVAYFTTPKYSVFPKGWKHLILPTLYLVLLILEKTRAEGTPSYSSYLVFLILVQSLFYSFISFLRIKKHKKNILSFASNTEEIDLNWIENIIKLILFLTSVICLYEMFFDTERLNIVLNFISLYIVYFVGVNLVKQKEIFVTIKNEKDEKETVFEVEDLERKLVSDDELEEFMAKLEQIMQTEKIYLDNDLNLVKLAEKVCLTPHQLSYVINKGFNNNFFQYVNAYRVERAKELLTHEEGDRLSILGIAYESGFNSKTAFYTIFKKETGLTPSGYKQKMKSKISPNL